MSAARKLDEKRTALAGYTLTLTHEGPGFRHYRLGPDAPTWMGVVILIFTSAPMAEQTIITGDLCPGDNGVISNRGYGIDWFGWKKSHGYLCEKFLREGFHTEVAQEWLATSLVDLTKELAELADDDADAEELLDARARIERRIEATEEAIEAGGDMGSGGSPTRHAEAFHEWYEETYGDGHENEGYGYEPSTAGWLCAINEKFAELYQAQIAEEAAKIAAPSPTALPATEMIA